MEDIPQEKERNSTTVKKHSPIIAFLCSLIIPGLGQWYNNQLAKGVLLALTGIALSYLFFFSQMGKSFTSAIAFFFMILAWYIYVLIDAVVIAIRRREYTQKKTSSLNALALYAVIIIAFYGFKASNEYLIQKYSVIEAFRIASGAMTPTLLPGDLILTDREYSEVGKPEREDIVVFKYPKDPNKNFVKRIVAIGQDTVEMKDKNLYINGNAVDEAFTNHSDNEVLPARMSRRDNFGPIQVPEGKVFVLGDNRDDSHDSRFWGFVDRKDIKGKALFIYWSWDRDKGKARFERIGMTLN